MADNTTFTTKQKIEAILTAAAAELAALVPDGDGEAMALLDERGKSYDWILDMPDDEQASAFRRVSKSEFGWIVSAAMAAFDDFRP
jgi:hypothetical protein